MAIKSSHVYASYLSPSEKCRNVEETEVSAAFDSSSKSRQIQVWAVGEAFAAPNRVRVSVVVRSQKETVADAKNSVSRRVDYVIQTLHTHNVKEGDVTISRSIRRAEGLYHVETEVVVVFVDLIKCQEVCNYLVEKLDDSVTVSLPHFYHASNSQDHVRRQACMNAVKNAKQKAFEVARLFRQSVGHPIMIREDQNKEWEGPAASQEVANDQEGPMTFQQRLTNGTFNALVKVCVCFELLSRDKGKENKT
ncbi:interleukin-1 receptor-associated kinase 1-binding protein 1-like [Diadema antillarum]|uniref:interleukin-1 receptor-associated kinase 1-binding protein 1-like n=1 Tax=Diadema antillarum TaxID=105358 RepID=UPI003A8452C5